MSNQIYIQNAVPSTKVDFEIEIEPSFEKIENIKILNYPCQNLLNVDLIQDVFGIEYLGITVTKIDGNGLHFEGNSQVENEGIIYESGTFILPK